MQLLMNIQILLKVIKDILNHILEVKTNKNYINGQILKERNIYNHHQISHYFLKELNFLIKYQVGYGI